MGGVGVGGGVGGEEWGGGEMKNDRTAEEGQISCVILKNWLCHVIEFYNTSYHTTFHTTSHDTGSYMISNMTYSLTLNYTTWYRQSNDITELGITYNIYHSVTLINSGNVL